MGPGTFTVLDAQIQAWLANARNQAWLTKKLTESSLDKFKLGYEEIGVNKPSERKMWLNKEQMEFWGFWASNVLLIVMVTFVHFTTR